MNEDLRKWFGKGGEGGVGGGGWDRYNTKGERIGKCAREPGEAKPKCLSKEKAAKMSKDEIAAAVRRKREEDPVADRPGKGGKPKMVSNKIEEQSDETRYCPMCRKRERRMDCSYGPAMWDAVTISGVTESKKPEPDHEHSMARSELSTIERAVKRLRSKMKGEGNIEAWVQSKITKAADYIDSAADYLDSGEHNVHGSMDEAKNKCPEGQYFCNRENKCKPIPKGYHLMPNGSIMKDSEMKEAKDPCWTGYKQVGMKKKNGKEVPNCVPEEVDLEEENKPTNPKLWAKWKAKAKAKFDVYPSAYANGWAAKGYKSEGGGWKSVSEETKVCEVCGKSPCECSPKRPMGGSSAKPGPNKNYVKPMGESVRIPSKTGNIILVTLSWRGKYFMIKLFFPQTTKPNRREVQDQIEKVYPGSRVQSYYVSDIKPGEQFLQVEGAAWTKKEGQNKEGGLNEKGRRSYEAENPGSDLKSPSKKVGNPRRTSFCARMKGMKKKLTSTKTANDPDSRINKSLRAWNC